jgi:hypothetical protein
VDLIQILLICRQHLLGRSGRMGRDRRSDHALLAQHCQEVFQSDGFLREPLVSCRPDLPAFQTGDILGEQRFCHVSQRNPPPRQPSAKAIGRVEILLNGVPGIALSMERLYQLRQVHPDRACLQFRPHADTCEKVRNHMLLLSRGIESEKLDRIMLTVSMPRRVDYAANTKG